MAEANEEAPVVGVPDMDDQAEAINTDFVISGTADDVEVCSNFASKNTEIVSWNLVSTNSVKLIDPYHVAHINGKMVNLVWNSEVDWETEKNKDGKKKLNDKFLDCNKCIIA